MEEKGKLQIESRNEVAEFDFTSSNGKYYLRGNVHRDIDSHVILMFAASVKSSNDGGVTYNTCGSINSNYDPSLGDDGLQFNFYSMTRKTMRDMGDVLDDCLDQLNELINK